MFLKRAIVKITISNIWNMILFFNRSLRFILAIKKFESNKSNQSNIVVVVACKIQCEKKIFKLVKKISIKCYFWFDWCNRVIFIHCFEKRSIDHLLNSQISLSLRKSKKSMQKENFFDRTIISVTYVDACDNDKLSILIQNINIAMQTIDVQSIHAQKSYHDVERVDQSFEKRKRSQLIMLDELMIFNRLWYRLFHANMTK